MSRMLANAGQEDMIQDHCKSYSLLQRTLHLAGEERG